MDTFRPHSARDQIVNSCWYLAFGDVLFMAALFAALAPGSFGVHEMAGKHYGLGVTILAPWLCGFAKLANFLHENGHITGHINGHIRCWLSIVIAVIFTALAAAAFFSL